MGREAEGRRRRTGETYQRLLNQMALPGITRRNSTAAAIKPTEARLPSPWGTQGVSQHRVPLLPAPWHKRMAGYQVLLISSPTESTHFYSSKVWMPHLSWGSGICSSAHIRKYHRRQRAIAL